KAYRIPPMHRGEAAEMVREIRAAPLLFGYRGSEQVDVASIEHLLLRLAQLKNDLPQVRSLELNLVLAGAQGATVLNAVGRVEPVADARSDWFVRRLSTQAGDTSHG
ncbi:MAG TPA: acetate--CoA ligase family protein, partial [Nocardioidaceae bacterium]|nr:acetate--CoA ligase family protein [Nocardioidaceae bacterium]